MSDAAHWAGTWKLSNGDVLAFEIGPLRLFVGRGPHEWHLGADRTDDAQSTTSSVARPATAERLEACTWRARYPAPSHVDRLRIVSRAADRPVIARPESTLIVPARAQTVVYVGSPVWVEVEVGEASVAQMPAWRPSDTWFGPSTTEGELCYASRTKARLSLHEMPSSPTRVVTQVTVLNETDQPVTVDRIGLPLPAMSVFLGADGRMWTESIRVALDDDGASPPRVDKRPPAVAGECRQLALPRRPPDNGGLVRAFSALISMSGGHAWTG